jgi:hypothetical protein
LARATDFFQPAGSLAGSEMQLLHAVGDVRSNQIDDCVQKLEGANALGADERSGVLVIFGRSDACAPGFAPARILMWLEAMSSMA